jgi:hypothetical protein
MSQLFPPRRRRTLYMLFGAGSCVLSYAAAKGWVGKDELELWAQLGVVFGFGAAAKVQVAKKRGKHADH